MSELSTFHNTSVTPSMASAAPSVDDSRTIAEDGTAGPEDGTLHSDDSKKGHQSGSTLGQEQRRDRESYPVIGEPVYIQKENADVEKATNAYASPEARAAAQAEAAEERKKEDTDPFLVTLKGRESINPHTWKASYRWFLTLLGGIFVLNGTQFESLPADIGVEYG